LSGISESKKRGFVRILPALVVAAGLLVSVSACSGGPASGFGGCAPVYSSGSASEQVTATGTHGKEPAVSFPTPLKSEGSQVTELDSGQGVPLRSGGVADIQVTIYNAATGDAITSSSYDESQAVRVVAGKADDLLGGLVQCATEGTRLAATSTATELFGDADVSQYNVAPDDTIVLVIDVQRTFLGRADGADQFPVAGFPSIALAPNGQPGLTIPSGAPPTETGFEVLKAGTGATVKKGDHVVIHYTGAVWDTRTVFSTSWDAGTPITVLAQSSADGAAGLVPGLADALIGQKVGSQFVVVIAPKDGYPAGEMPTGVADNSTLIFVIDVLGIK
jgi:peptidylprolyl isomerase